ncbi:MAG: Ldh family oxidoreductase [Deltaproteobacteria bacterium]|nr:Ldh family oxidoreductase [Deltaproteobacteria bacterium]
MPKVVNIRSNELCGFIQAVLERLSVPAADAKVVSDCLVFAHLRGFDTHGLPCLAGYVECLEQGRIKPTPTITVERPMPWAIRLDADNGLGQIAAHRAMTLAIEAADQLGVGAAVVRRSNHFGAACCYSMLALPRDCIGLVTSNAMAAAAPFGALESFLGTNPLSVAVPALTAPPFVIDMATSEGARKKVRQALSLGTPLPAGWALDKDGNPTTDPKAALEGVMLPFGGMKGSAITLLLDILSGVLSGAEFGGRVLSVLTNQQRESGNGNFMLVLKVASFMPAEEFKGRMDEELARLRALRPARGLKEVIYPGYKEHFTEISRKEQGIPLAAAVVEEARSIGKRHGVVFHG